MKIEIELDTSLVLKKLREITGYDGPVDIKVLEDTIRDDIVNTVHEEVYHGYFLEIGVDRDVYFDVINPYMMHLPPETK